jgi:hypothetical protein
MRPESHGNDAGSGLGLARHADEFDVSAMNSIKVADHYNGRPTHPMRLLVFTLAASNS